MCDERWENVNVGESINVTKLFQVIQKKYYLQFFNFQRLFLTDQIAVLLKNSFFRETYSNTINLDSFQIFLLKFFPIHRFYTREKIHTTPEKHSFLHSFARKNRF